MTQNLLILYLFVCFITPLSIQCQENINLNDLIISTNEIEHFSGQLIQEGKHIFLKSNDCSLKDRKISLKGSNSAKYNASKWFKKVKANKGTLKNVIVKGVLSKDKLSVQVEKIDKPLQTPKKWSNGTSALYLDTAVNLYKKTIDLRENYRVFSISVEEVEDPNLGSVTEYIIYDRHCNKLGPDEIKKITSKELSALNASIKLGGELLIKQAALTKLAEQSLLEIDQLSPLKKIAPGKDSATAGVFQTAILTQLPKIIKNLKASKQYIERLRAE